MIGHKLDQIEFELFNMIYALAVLEQLVKDNLLICNAKPSVHSTAFETLTALSLVYPLPTYDILSEYAYDILTRENKQLYFSKNDLKKLMEDVEVNNGYIL